MATILKRTAFYEVVKKDGTEYFLPHDWALVLTTLGPMAEPFNFNQKFRNGCGAGDYPAFTMDEEVTMVNDLICMDSNIPHLGEQVHGGRQAPRDGR